MKQRQIIVPILGLLFWVGLILLFNRHDLAFYAVSFLLSATLTLLVLAESSAKKTEEVEVKVYHD